MYMYTCKRETACIYCVCMLCVCSVISNCIWGLRPKQGGYFYDGNDLDRAPSLNWREEMITQYAARLVYEKGGMGFGII